MDFGKAAWRLVPEQYIAVTFEAPALLLGKPFYTERRLDCQRPHCRPVNCPTVLLFPALMAVEAGTANDILGQDPYPDPQYQGTI